MSITPSRLHGRRSTTVGGPNFMSGWTVAFRGRGRLLAETPEDNLDDRLAVVIEAGDGSRAHALAFAGTAAADDVDRVAKDGLSGERLEVHLLPINDKLL